MRRTSADVLVAAAVGFVASAYRFLSHSSFANDHFVHLAKAQSWLAGDWPLRDYTDVGAILTIAVSAAAQAVFGESLLPELILSVGMLGAGAAATYSVTMRITGSRLFAGLAVLLQVLILPRLYSYPKILLYPVMILLLIRYADRPTMPRLFAAAAWVSIGFLFRHDHGVYLGAAAALALTIVHWHEGWRTTARTIATCAALALGCVAPFLLYVQRYVGVVEYFRLGVGTSQGEASRVRNTLPAFHIDSGAWVVRRPAAAGELPRIHIRWAERVDEQARAAREREVPLLFPEQVDGRTWRYRIDWDRAAGLRPLLEGTDVEDISGIDRRTLALDEPRPIADRTLSAIGLSRLAPGPALASLSQNALPLLYYTAWALPVVAMLLWSRVRKAGVQADRSAGALRADGTIPVLCVLVALCTIGFQRDDPAARAPDVFGTVPILLSWVLAALLTITDHAAVARAVAATLAILVTASVVIAGNTREMLDRTGLWRGPAGLVARAAATAHSAREWPWAAQWPGHEEWRLAQYVHDCTQPGDHLLVTWFAPEYYFFSRRPFAGREVVLQPLYRDPSTYEASELESWKRRRVPLVLAESASFPRFAAAYPALAAHLSSQYRRVAETPWKDSSIVIYVERTRTTNGRDREFGWECAP